MEKKGATEKKKNFMRAGKKSVCAPDREGATSARSCTQM